MKTFAALIATVGIFISGVVAEDSPVFQFHGEAWMDLGRIMQSSDTIQNDGSSINVNNNWLQSPGAQITATAQFGDDFDAALGFGTFLTYHSLATSTSSSGFSTNQPSFRSIPLFKNFISKANLTYHQGDEKAPWLSVTLGNFSYDYNPDAQDFGLYLLRGPVYPGLLMGGYQDFTADTTKSNVLGAKIHNSIGNFGQDLILMNELDVPPTYDWSLLYIAKLTVIQALQIGGGVNFYRLIPYNSKLEVPGHLIGDNDQSISVNSAGDTTYYTNQGIKVMGTFDLDFKPLFDLTSMGSNDMKLYGEAAILGVKNYGTYYHDIMQRIPVMGGFNFPAFGLLDRLSLEVEWYGSPYRDDFYNLGLLNGVADWTIEQRPIPSPTPAVAEPYPDSTRDNWKWSILIQKTVHKHFLFSAQAADDHYRPRPIAAGFISASGGTAEAFTTPKDWYFMFHIGYFF